MSTQVNLGKIRPTYRGTYSSTVAYDFNDVVDYKGSVYIVTNLAGSVAGILPTDTTKWVLLMDGSQFVHTSGNETIEGYKTFTENITRSTPGDLMTAYSTESISVVPPTITETFDITIVDPNNKRAGKLEFSRHPTNGRVIQVSMRSRDDSATYYLGLREQIDNQVYAFCPTPPESSDNASIATTKWSRNLIDKSFTPSGSAIGIAFPSTSGSVITAPCTGWVHLSAIAGAGGQYISLNCNGVTGRDFSYMTGDQLSVYVPVAKEASVDVRWTTTGGGVIFRAFKALGAR